MKKCTKPTPLIKSPPRLSLMSANITWSWWRVTSCRPDVNGPITTHPLSVGGGAASGEYRALSLCETMSLGFFPNHGSSAKNSITVPLSWHVCSWLGNVFSPAIKKFPDVGGHGGTLKNIPLQAETLMLRQKDRYTTSVAKLIYKWRIVSVLGVKWNILWEYMKVCVQGYAYCSIASCLKYIFEFIAGSIPVIQCRYWLM